MDLIGCTYAPLLVLSSPAFAGIAGGFLLFFGGAGAARRCGLSTVDAEASLSATELADDIDIGESVARSIASEPDGIEMELCGTCWYRCGCERSDRTGTLCDDALDNRNAEDIVGKGGGGAILIPAIVDDRFSTLLLVNRGGVGRVSSVVGDTATCAPKSEAAFLRCVRRPVAHSPPRQRSASRRVVGPTSFVAPRPSELTIDSRR